MAAAALRRLHAVTADWPQRPSFASTHELLTADRGGDADLSMMPPDAISACRAAWRRLAGTPQAAVHGDPGPPNVRMTSAGAGLLDWDEARVDYTDLDLADLPEGDRPAPYLPPARLAAARSAVRAWEAASGWRAEPSYARLQLARLRSDAAGQADG
jgi:Ser/Thr protein kinase RdoA (MazF antagonist)